MRIIGILAAAATALMLGTGLCSAATFSFDFTPNRSGRNSVTASGTFVTDDAPDISVVTAVSGTVNGARISGLDDTGFNIYLVDTNAVAFSFFNGDGVRFSLFSGASGTDTAMSDAGQSSRGTLSISPSAISPVPLPAAAPLFAAAVLALGVAGCGLKRRAAASA